MGKISSYTSVTTQSTDDLLICDQDVGGTLTTMKTTVGKVGTAVAEVQTHAALDTTNKTIVGAINEVGSLPDTSSGSIATFTTSLEKPLVACEVDQNATKLIQTSGNNNTLNEYIRGIFLGTYGFVDLGTLNWSNASGVLASSDGVSSMAKRPSANSQAFNGLCSIYTVAPRTNISDKQISIQTNGNIVISDSSISGMSGEQIANYLNGATLIYELETPTTPTITEAQFTALCTAFGIDGDIYDLPLTPLPTTYSGTNNFFTDYNASVSVTYLETIKEYIDKRVTP